MVLLVDPMSTLASKVDDALAFASPVFVWSTRIDPGSEHRACVHAGGCDLLFDWFLTLLDVTLPSNWR